MTIIKKEIAQKPTPEELKEGNREWTLENDREMREKRATEGGFVVNDGDERNIKLVKKIEFGGEEK